ncbi:hypothetical protein G6F37_010498 [Rhizopus arrhizus]|nr:hypothetical protein G6F38_009070 [Rhizopus arrhizus]KAG1153282.1 hypothetical protein G6F37_010498 [Rhizopus arrhizus]
MSRYCNILNAYLSDDNRRKLLTQKYKTWKSSKRSKAFWQEREVKRQQLTQGFRSSSEISTTADNAVDFNTSPINLTSTNKSLYVMDTSKAIELIESNIASSADNQGEYIIDGVDILKQFNIFQHHILGMLETTSLKYTNHLDHALATASVLMLSKTKKINLGFSKVKTTKYVKNPHKLNVDLYRLGVFSKNTINANHLDGALSIQITGTSIAFFLTEKKREGLYLMTELDVIKFPTTLKEIPQLLGYVDNLCDILHVFHTKCWPHPGRF